MSICRTIWTSLRFGSTVVIPVRRPALLSCRPASGRGRPGCLPSTGRSSARPQRVVGHEGEIDRPLIAIYLAQRDCKGQGENVRDGLGKSAVSSSPFLPPLVFRLFSVDFPLGNQDH